LGAGDVMVEAVAYVPRLVRLDSQLSERCRENGRIGFRRPGSPDIAMAAKEVLIPRQLSFSR
jgi:hypothetical protein